MTWTVIGLVAGALIGALWWSVTARSFDVEALRRSNYRGVEVLTGVGILIPLTVVLLVACTRPFLAVEDAFVSWDRLTFPTVVAVVGFGLFGLLDDVVGAGQSGGFAGHVSSLRDGVVTSGMIKVVGGGAVALLTVSMLGQGDATALGMLRDGATLALAANLGNLLDRAPGRTTKCVVVVFVGTAFVARSPALLAPALAVGAGIGLLAPDLRERLMLGDAGANVLGAMCAMAAFEAFHGPGARWVLFGAVAALNLLSEVVSFSSVIEAVGPLRWFDRLGSLRNGP